MQQGWIKLHRSILENFLWQEKRTFNRSEAWLELLLTASYEDRKVLISGQPVNVKAGQTATTMAYLAEHWGWSRKKVKGFFDLLVQEEMIATQCTSKYTLVTILKWGFYQNQDTPEEQQKNIKSTTEEHQKNTIKEIKNIKNINNKPYSGDGGGGSKTRARASEESLPVDKAPLEAGAAEAADSHPICYPPEVRAYVDALFAQYRTKRPSNADYDRAIPYACRPAYDENGESYPVLDEEKAKLLEYAFEQGTENGNTSWRYISGMYKRFAERGIETVEDANRYEWQRATGQTPKEFIDRFYGSDNLCEI